MKTTSALLILALYLACVFAQEPTDNDNEETNPEPDTNDDTTDTDDQQADCLTSSFASFKEDYTSITADIESCLTNETAGADRIRKNIETINGKVDEYSETIDEYNECSGLSCARLFLRLSRKSVDLGARLGVLNGRLDYAANQTDDEEVKECLNTNSAKLTEATNQIGHCN